MEFHLLLQPNYQNIVSIIYDILSKKDLNEAHIIYNGIIILGYGCDWIFPDGIITPSTFEMLISTISDTTLENLSKNIYIHVKELHKLWSDFEIKNNEQNDLKFIFNTKYTEYDTQKLDDGSIGFIEIIKQLILNVQNQNDPEYLIESPTVLKESMPEFSNKVNLFISQVQLGRSSLLTCDGFKMLIDGPDLSSQEVCQFFKVFQRIDTLLCTSWNVHNSLSLHHMLESWQYSSIGYFILPQGNQKQCSIMNTDETNSFSLNIKQIVNLIMFRLKKLECSISQPLSDVKKSFRLFYKLGSGTLQMYCIFPPNKEALKSLKILLDSWDSNKSNGISLEKLFCDTSLACILHWCSHDKHTNISILVPGSCSENMLLKSLAVFSKTDSLLNAPVEVNKSEIKNTKESFIKSKTIDSVKSLQHKNTIPTQKTLIRASSENNSKIEKKVSSTFKPSEKVKIVEKDIPTVSQLKVGRKEIKKTIVISTKLEESSIIDTNNLVIKEEEPKTKEHSSDAMTNEDTLTNIGSMEILGGVEELSYDAETDIYLPDDKDAKLTIDVTMLDKEILDNIAKTDNIVIETEERLCDENKEKIQEVREDNCPNVQSYKALDHVNAEVKEIIVDKQNQELYEMEDKIDWEIIEDKVEILKDDNSKIEIENGYEIINSYNNNNKDNFTDSKKIEGNIEEIEIKKIKNTTDKKYKQIVENKTDFKNVTDESKKFDIEIGGNNDNAIIDKEMEHDNQNKAYIENEKDIVKEVDTEIKHKDISQKETENIEEVKLKINTEFKVSKELSTNIKVDISNETKIANREKTFECKIDHELEANIKADNNNETNIESKEDATCEVDAKNEELDLNINNSTIEEDNKKTTDFQTEEELKQDEEMKNAEEVEIEETVECKIDHELEANIKADNNNETNIERKENAKCEVDANGDNEDEGVDENLDYSKNEGNDNSNRNLTNEIEVVKKDMKGNSNEDENAGDDKGDGNNGNKGTDENEGNTGNEGDSHNEGAKEDGENEGAEGDGENDGNEENGGDDGDKKNENQENQERTEAKKQSTDENNGNDENKDDIVNEDKDETDIEIPGCGDNDDNALREGKGKYIDLKTKGTSDDKEDHTNLGDARNKENVVHTGEEGNKENAEITEDDDNEDEVAKKDERENKDLKAEAADSYKDPMKHIDDTKKEDARNLEDTQIAGDGDNEHNKDNKEAVKIKDDTKNQEDVVIGEEEENSKLDTEGADNSEDTIKHDSDVKEEDAATQVDGVNKREAGNEVEEGNKKDVEITGENNNEGNDDIKLAEEEDDSGNIEDALNEGECGRRDIYNKDNATKQKVSGEKEDAENKVKEGIERNAKITGEDNNECEDDNKVVKENENNDGNNKNDTNEDDEEIRGPEINKAEDNERDPIKLDNEKNGEDTESNLEDGNEKDAEIVNTSNEEGDGANKVAKEIEDVDGNDVDAANKVEEENKGDIETEFEEVNEKYFEIEIVNNDEVTRKKEDDCENNEGKEESRYSEPEETGHDKEDSKNQNDGVDKGVAVSEVEIENEEKTEIAGNDCNEAAKEKEYNSNNQGDAVNKDEGETQDVITEKTCDNENDSTKPDDDGHEVHAECDDSNENKVEKECDIGIENNTGKNQDNLNQKAKNENEEENEKDIEIKSDDVNEAVEQKTDNDGNNEDNFTNKGEEENTYEFNEEKVKEVDNINDGNIDEGENKVQASNDDNTGNDEIIEKECEYDPKIIHVTEEKNFNNKNEENQILDSIYQNIEKLETNDVVEVMKKNQPDLVNEEGTPIQAWNEPLGLPMPVMPNKDAVNKRQPGKSLERPSPQKTSIQRSKSRERETIPGYYMDICYVPVDSVGNVSHARITDQFFTKVRAKCYIIPGQEHDLKVLNNIIIGKSKWSIKDKATTTKIIPMNISKTLEHWLIEQKIKLEELNIQVETPVRTDGEPMLNICKFLY